jgi:putative transposase
MSNANIIRGLVVRLYPTAEQSTRLLRWMGALRFMWNRFIDAEQAQYEHDGSFLWRTQLHAIGQGLRREHDWIADVPANATIQVAADFDTALRRMVRERKAGRRCGFPRRKKRGVRECSIYCANNKTRIAPDLRGVTLPKLGAVKARGLQPIDGRLYAARIRRDGDRWMLSLQFLCERPAPLPPSDTAVAVDLGVNRLATIFDGESFLHITAPRPLRRAERMLKRRQRRLSRRQKGSRRRLDQQRRVAAVHRKTRNRRKEAVHQFTNRLTAKAGSIIIEDLNVRGMARGRLAKSVNDAALGMVVRTLAYKADWRGRELVKVDRFFPSSQICSCCGTLHREMRDLSRRVLRCDCGNVLDRDENAAANLYWYREGLGNRPVHRPTRGERGDQAHGPVPLIEPRIAPGFMS